jgi:hypothetical protein
MFSVPLALEPQIHKSMRGRRLVLVDIENVVGGAVHTTEEAHWAREEVQNLIGVRDMDQVVVGTSHIGLFPTLAAWSYSRIVVRSGENGADLALLDVMESENIHQRFEELVLISGDGIFTEEVSRLGALGVHVTVVGHHEGVSKRLSMAASETLNFTNEFAQIGDVA